MRSGPRQEFELACRPDGVPIWISGRLRGGTVDRLVKYGPRWIPRGEDADNLVESLPQLKDALAKAGGDVESLQVAGGLPVVWTAGGEIDVPRTMDGVGALRHIGVTGFSLPWNPRAKDEAAAEAKLRPIVDAFRAAAA